MRDDGKRIPLKSDLDDPYEIRECGFSSSRNSRLVSGIIQQRFSYKLKCGTGSAWSFLEQA